MMSDKTFRRLVLAWKPRGRRAEYWVAIAVIVALEWVGRAILHAPILIELVTLPIWLVFASRRLHDFGAGAQWCLIPLAMSFILGFLRSFMAKQGVDHFMAAPIWPATANLISLVEMVAIGSWPGNADENRFGPPPARRRSTAAVSEFG
jgi:uncharacterized membrane protein YhaH (DUF805 family)